jgi:hypothetical protein
VVAARWGAIDGDSVWDLVHSDHVRVWEVRRLMAKKRGGQDDEGEEMPVRGLDGHVRRGENLDFYGVEKKADRTEESWRTSLEVGRNGIVHLRGWHRYDYNCV